MTRLYSLAYLSSHRCSPAEAIQVAAVTGYRFVGLRLWPNAPGAPQPHLLGNPDALREPLAVQKDTPINGTHFTTQAQPFRPKQFWWQEMTLSNPA